MTFGIIIILFSTKYEDQNMTYLAMYNSEITFKKEAVIMNKVFLALCTGMM